MAGKPLVLTTRRLGHALDKLSKNALIDLVVDLARKDVGETESEETLAHQIEIWMGPVLRERGDKPVSLMGYMRRLDANDQAYRDRTGAYTQVPEGGGS